MVPRSLLVLLSSSLIVLSAASRCFNPSRPSMEKADGTELETAAVVTATALAMGFFGSLADVDPDIFDGSALIACCCNTSDYRKSNF